MLSCELSDAGDGLGDGVPGRSFAGARARERRAIDAEGASGSDACSRSSEAKADGGASSSETSVASSQAAFLVFVTGSVIYIVPGHPSWLANEFRVADLARGSVAASRHELSPLDDPRKMLERFGWMVEKAQCAPCVGSATPN